MPAIECNQLARWYGDVIAVNDLTVEVREGGITGLLGPNGAGKSTLMKICMGLLRPSAGSIHVLGEDPWDNAQLLAKIGYVPEGDAPWRRQAGRDACIHGARLSGLAPEQAAEAADKALAKVGLTEHAGRKVETYSRGMRQRLKFALALQHEPDLYILDEPLLGTDPLTRRDLIQLIRSLAQAGKSVLLSTHILPDIEAMTDRILVLNQGRLMAHGDLDHIRSWLEKHPRTVRISTPKPRELGAVLWSWDTVLSIQDDDGSVLVRTKRLKEFFEQLQNHLLESRTPFTSVTTTDDNVEAIFRYLVG